MVPEPWSEALSSASPVRPVSQAHLSALSPSPAPTGPQNLIELGEGAEHCPVGPQTLC